jgi:hypothetical protein
LRAFRQASLQYLTCSQSRSHFFRQVNGRPQATQIFEGRLLVSRGIVTAALSLIMMTRL